jgi:hypothetical protein
MKGEEGERKGRQGRECKRREERGERRKDTPAIRKILSLLSENVRRIALAVGVSWI